MIEQECIDELAAEIGLRAEVAAITERAMRGEIAFEPALRERVALLKGLARRRRREACSRSRITIMPGARDAGRHDARRRRPHGARLRRLHRLRRADRASESAFDEHRAKRCSARPARFTGLVAEPILGRDAKEQALRRADRAARARPGGDAGGRRRRQRSRHDPPRRARRRLSRQAGAARRRPTRRSTTPT